ncbi:MAG: MoaD/ThiS family protein [Deltaproteobacteria bacterium]|nr:MoaD/ThiS family protein [Deltaproteobacteria bacterium]
MRVVVPTHLQRYTARVAEVDAEGATLAEVLVDLDRRYPGIRFRVVDEQDRIRPHIKFFVGEELAHTLAVPIDGRDVLIVAAFSGG